MAASAPVNISTTTTVAGTGTSRVFAVTTATSAGDTILVCVNGNTTIANSNITALTDSKGNVYTLDGTPATTSPSAVFFRSAGATGGSGGGQTAALTTSDTWTVTTGTFSFTCGILAVKVTGAGALDVSAGNFGATVSSVSQAVTTTKASDDIIALGIAQSSGVTLSAAAPFTAGTQVTASGILIPLYDLAVGAAGSYTCQMNIATAATARLYVWAFQPAAVTPALPDAGGAADVFAVTPAVQQSAPVHVRGAGPVAVTLPQATGTGNTLVVCASTNGSTGNPTVSGITLGGSADHFAKASQLNSGTRNDAEIWYDPNAASGQTAVSVSFGGGTGTLDLYVEVYELPGILLLDQVVTGEGNGTAWSSGATPTTTVANEFFVGCMINTGSTVPTVTGAGTWQGIQQITAQTYTQTSALQQATATGTATFSGSLGATARNYTIAVATFYLGKTVALADAGGAADSVATGTTVVTATQGGSTQNGILLRLFVLTNANTTTEDGKTAAANAALSVAAGSTSYNGSRLYGANLRSSSAGLTALANTTQADAQTDTTHVATYGTFRSTSSSVAAFNNATYGDSDTGGVGVVLAEIRGSGGTITEDASGPAVAFTTTATSVSSAPFTPPAGAVLLALVSSNGGAAVATMAVSDSGTLTWTEKVKQNATGGGYVGVWWAAVPGGAATPALADAAGATEALAVSAAVPVADVAGAAETLSVTVTLPLPDQAAAADQAPVTAESIALADAAAAADALAVPAETIPLPDAAGAVEALSVSVTVPLPDAAGAADVLGAVTAPYQVATGLTTGAGTSRTATVAAPTSAGDTLLALVTTQATACTISALTDSRGNVYILDRSYTAIPLTYAFRSPGATGGPTGGPTVALAVNDTVTATSAAQTGNVEILLIDVPDVLGVDQISAMATGTNGTPSVSATPTQNGEICVVLQSNNNTGGAPAVGSPFSLIATYHTGVNPYNTAAYNQLAAGAGSGVAQNYSATITAIAWCAVMYTFPPGVPNVDVAAGTDAVTVSATLSVPDIAGAADAVSVAAAVPALADRAGAADSLFVNMGMPPVTDAAGAAETFSVVVTLPAVTDAAGAAEALSVAVAMSLADNAGAADAVTSSPLATVQPRCSRTGDSGTTSTTTISPNLTSMTNEASGLAGTAPVPGDLVVLLVQMHLANQTISQTADTGNLWTIMSTDNNGGGIGMTSVVLYRWWTGGENAPVFTTSSSLRVSFSVMAFGPTTPGQYVSMDPGSITAMARDQGSTTHPPPAATAAGGGECSVVLMCATGTGPSTANITYSDGAWTIKAWRSNQGDGTSGAIASTFGTAMGIQSSQGPGTVTPDTWTVQVSGQTTNANMYHLLLSASPVPPITLINRFDATPAGTAITPANSGDPNNAAFDVVQLTGTGNSLNADASAAAFSGQSAKFILGANVSNGYYCEWGTQLGGPAANKQLWFRFYYFTSTALSANWRAFQINQQGDYLSGVGQPAMWMRIPNTTNKWTVLDATGATLYTSTASIPLNTWIRVEGTVIGDPANGGIQVSVYPTAFATATPETYTAMTGLNTGGPMGFIHFGGPVSASGYTWSIDEVGVSNVGPLGAVVPCYDYAAAADSFAVSKMLNFADAAGAAESMAPPSEGIFPVDAAGAVESLGIGVPIAEAAGAAESLSVSVTIGLADRAAAIDTATAPATIQLADAGASTDANVARLPAITITATAGGSTGNGLLIHPIPFSIGTAYPGNTLVSGTGSGNTSANATLNNPKSIGGVLYASIMIYQSPGVPAISTTIAGTVTLENPLVQSSHTMLIACYCNIPLSAGVPQQIGYTATAAMATGLAAAEVQPGEFGPPTIDAQAPAYTSSATGSAITSASFQPPAGGLLMVIVGANGGAASETMAVTDTMGLTWTSVRSEAAGAGETSIWFARVPGLPPATNPVGDAAGATEQLSMAMGIPEADAAGAVEALSVSQTGSSPALPDTAGAADAVAISAAVSEADTAGAADALSVIKNIPIALADAAGAADACGMNMPVALADQAASIEAPNAGKMQTLQDAFPGTSLNTTTWYTYGTISVSGGVVSLTDTASSVNYAGFQSNLRYDLTNSYLLVQLVNAGTQQTSTQAVLEVQLDGNNLIQLLVNNGNLIAQYALNNVYTVVLSAPYNATSMKWLRISESGGTVTFAYSASGSSWTTFTTLADPFGLTNVIAVVQEGQYGGADPAATSQWANVNTAPTGSPSSADAAGTLDKIVIAATLPAATDAAAGTDQLFVNIAPPGQADAAGAADVLAGPSVTLPLADPAGAADVLARTIALAPIDAAGAIEALAVTVAVPLPEQAAAADVLAGLGIPQQDVAGAAERLNLGMTPADAAGAAEQLATGQLIAQAEAAGAAEALTAAVALPVADAAGAADAIVVQLGTPTTEPDVAGATDAITTAITGQAISLADVAAASYAHVAGPYSFTQTVTLGLAERAGAAETVSAGIAGFPVPGDAAGATEALLVTVTVALAEAAASTEALPAQVTLVLAEQAGASDAAGYVPATIRGWAEYAGAADVLRSPASVPLREPAGAADQLTVAKKYLPVLAETAGASEHLAVVIGLAKTAAEQAGAVEALTVPARIVRPAEVAAAAERIALPAKTLPVADAAAGTEALKRASVYFGACNIVCRASVHAAGARTTAADALWEAYLAAAQKAIDIESNIEEDLIAGGKGAKYGADYAELYDAQLAAFDAYHAYEDAKEAVPYGSVKSV